MSVKECCCVELSLNKKSIFGLRMRNQIWYLILVVCFLPIISAADTEISCSNVKNFFERKGMLAVVDIQDQPNSDAGELCLNRGCCGAGARPRLTQHAHMQLEGSIRSELSKLAETLSTRARRFDEFFRKLLKTSREEFHTMFKRTYGMIYEQHSYVFQKLFDELERYYTHGDTDFDLMMDKFFGILCEKMFTVLNAQYSFDEKYLKCVNSHMREIQPFEDVPNKLSVQLKRAIVATKTFHKALRSGADVVRNMMQVGVTQECMTAWARLRYCGSCADRPQLACSRYCHNVIRGCLPLHADLGEQWDAYVDAVDKVADRLLGPFNIAMVIEPIDIKVSEAIMNFQEHNQEISQKIFAGCGKPVLGGVGGAGPFFTPEKSRRSVRSVPDFDWNQKSNDVDDFEIEASFESLLNDDPSLLSLRTPEGIRKATEEMAEQAKSRERFLQYMRGKINLKDYEDHERRKREAEPEAAAGGSSEIGFKPYEFDGKRGSKKKKPSGKSEEDHGTEWSGPALDKLVRETRGRIRNSRRYWSQLAALLCTSTSVTSSPCFNGTDAGSYSVSSSGEGKAALASNPEVRGTVVESVAARAQHDALKTLTARLKDAYNGVEVKWKDDVDQQSAASSFTDLEDIGSGSGSGDDTDDLTDDDEDRGNSYSEGSGLVPPDIDDAIDRDVGKAPPVTEAPFIPNIVEPPSTNNVNIRTSTNVNIRGRIGEPVEPSDIVPQVDTTSDRTEDREPPVREEPVAASADRPSLQKALFTYALPVVCAWFGTIVTDLF